MTNLEKLISEIRETASWALPRPWEAYFVFGSSDLPACIESSAKDSNGKTLEVCQVADWYTEENQPTGNFRLITLATNNIEKLAQACEVMRGVLERLHSDIGIESKWCDCSEIALEAIEQVEKILGGE